LPNGSLVFTSQQILNDRLHPNHSQTIAWARVYKFDDKWIIEELQSDIWGATLKTNEHYAEDTRSKPVGVKILENLSGADKTELERFFYKHFVEWDKKAPRHCHPHGEEGWGS
jgi:hypothetical protein